VGGLSGRAVLLPHGDARHAAEHELRLGHLCGTFALCRPAMVYHEAKGFQGTAGQLREDACNEGTGSARAWGQRTAPSFVEPRGQRQGGLGCPTGQPPRKWCHITVLLRFDRARAMFIAGLE